MNPGIRTFKKKNIGAGKKQDQYFLSLSKVAVTKSLFILEKNTRDATWGLVLA